MRPVRTIPGLHRPAEDTRPGRHDALSGSCGADGAYPERFGGGRAHRGCRYSAYGESCAFPLGELVRVADKLPPLPIRPLETRDRVHGHILQGRPIQLRYLRLRQPHAVILHADFQTGLAAVRPANEISPSSIRTKIEIPPAFQNFSGIWIFAKIAIVVLS